MKRSFFLTLCFSMAASAQDAAPATPPSPDAKSDVNADAPTSPKLEPVAKAEAPAPKPFVTSAFSYGARRAWFNGTRLLGAGLYYQASYAYGLGGTVRADGVAPFQMNGIRIVERHGFISTLLMKAVTGIIALLGMLGRGEHRSALRGLLHRRRPDLRGRA